MDVDGDGELSAEEIFEALSANNSDVTLDRVKELVAKADKNGNGTVSREEYMDALAADIIPEGWRGTLSKLSTAAAEASSAAAAKLGPAAKQVRKAAARATASSLCCGYITLLGFVRQVQARARSQALNGSFSDWAGRTNGLDGILQ